MFTKKFQALANDWIIIAVIALIAQLLYPTIARSAQPNTELKNITNIVEYFNDNRPEFRSLLEERVDTLPEVGYAPLVRTMTVEATAYTNLAALTDSSPNITASGKHVGYGQIAANFLPFGAKVRMPELYGDQIFVVTDRMNTRYGHHVDVFLPTYDQAIRFGYKPYIEIEILR